MSDKNQKVEGCVSTSKYAIVRKIKALFNMGDEGKLESFLDRVIKSLTTDQKAHKQNLATEKFNHDQKMDKLNDQLEDLKVELEESFSNIPIANVETNALQTSYVSTYLSNISRKEKAVEAKEEEIKVAQEAYDKTVEETNKQIELLQDRIDKISTKPAATK